MTTVYIIYKPRTLGPRWVQNNCNDGQICPCPLQLYFQPENMEEKLLFEISLGLANSPILQTWKTFYHNISLKLAVRINGMRYAWLKS